MTDQDPAVIAKLPITQDWTVVAFREGKTEANPHGGQLTKFYVDFVGADETEVPDVYWRRKAGNVPEINKPVYGTISQGNYGPMFKMEQKDGGGFSAPTPQQQQSTGRDDYWERKEERDVAGVKRMGRAHAQEMALRMVETTRDAADLDLTDPALVATYLNEVVRKLTDWFETDVNKAG